MPFSTWRPRRSSPNSITDDPQASAICTEYLHENLQIAERPDSVPLPSVPTQVKPPQTGTPSGPPHGRDARERATDALDRVAPKRRTGHSNRREHWSRPASPLAHGTAWRTPPHVCAGIHKAAPDSPIRMYQLPIGDPGGPSLSVL